MTGNSRCKLGEDNPRTLAQEDCRIIARCSWHQSGRHQRSGERPMKRQPRRATAKRQLLTVGNHLPDAPNPMTRATSNELASLNHPIIQLITLEPSRQTNQGEACKVVFLATLPHRVLPCHYWLVKSYPCSALGFISKAGRRSACTSSSCVLKRSHITRMSGSIVTHKKASLPSA
jgi:hypothetical protein